MHHAQKTVMRQFHQLEAKKTMPQQDHKATVLTGKMKIMIVEEAVHEDDEFAHAGGHGDEGFLAGGPQAQIKLFEDAVVPHSTQGRHVEGAPHRRAAAVNAPDSILAATVAVVRGHT